MYAVVRTGGKQYRVGPGDTVEVEKLEGDVGDEITLDDVLLVSNGEQVTIGQPTVDGATVAATITGQYRGPKVLSFRYRPKKRIRVRRGHRQYITRLQIQSVGLNGATHTDATELGPKPTVEFVPKKRKKKGQTTATFIPVADAASGIVDDAGETLTDAVDTAEANIDAIEETASDAVEAATDAVDTVEDAAGDVVDAVKDVAEGAVDAATDVVDNAAGAASDAVDAASDAASDA